MTTFISHASADSSFAQQLTLDLRKRKVPVWLAELDIPKGARWDREVQTALEGSTQLALVLSPATEQSENVLDEVAFALETNRPIIPLLLKPCRKPYRVIRLQHIDFTSSYPAALSSLLAALTVSSASTQPDPASSPAPHQPAPRRVFVSCNYKEQQIRELVSSIARQLGLEPVEANTVITAGPIREGIVQLISTCDFFVSVLTASREEETSPWLLWELGVTTSMALPTQILVHKDAAKRAALRLFPDRQLHVFSQANIAQVVRTALSQFAALPPRPNYSRAPSDT